MVGFLAVSAGIVGAQCSVYDTSLLVPATPGVTPKGGVGFWSGPGDRGCFSARAPTEADRPPHGSDKVLPPIYLAVQSTRLGSLNEEGGLDLNAWQDIGFDLDGICTGVESCTGDDSPPSCKPTVPQISTDGRAPGRYATCATSTRSPYTASDNQPSPRGLWRLNNPLSHWIKQSEIPIN